MLCSAYGAKLASGCYPFCKTNATYHNTETIIRVSAVASFSSRIAPYLPVGICLTCLVTRTDAAVGICKQVHVCRGRIEGGCGSICGCQSQIPTLTMKKNIRHRRHRTLGLPAIFDLFQQLICESIVRQTSTGIMAKFLPDYQTGADTGFKCAGLWCIQMLKGNANADHIYCRRFENDA